MEKNKINLAQQKHAVANQKKCTTTQNKHKKLKPWFIRLFATSGLKTDRVCSQRKK